MIGRKKSSLLQNDQRRKCYTSEIVVGDDFGHKYRCEICTRGGKNKYLWGKKRNIAEAQIKMRNMHGSAHGAAARQAGPEVTQHSWLGARDSSGGVSYCFYNFFSQLLSKTFIYFHLKLLLQLLFIAFIKNFHIKLLL